MDQVVAQALTLFTKIAGADDSLVTTSRTSIHHENGNGHSNGRGKILTGAS
jgi:hypothetical protein